MDNIESCQLRDLQIKGLDIALYLKKFCSENNLKFYLCGGCCIGALRNKGFIPWDDDVDVFMPRNDYERLKVIWKDKADTNKYSCVFSDENTVDHNLFVTIRDNDTTFIKPYQSEVDIPHGVALDVLPLDGYPDSKIKRVFQVIWALIFSLYCAQTIPVKHGKAAEFLSKLALLVIPGKKARYKLWKLAERKMTKYSIEKCDNITELCSGPYYMKKKYPKSAFVTAKLVEFEGHMLPIPIDYDKYLKNAFGNYMILPPEEKRVPAHDFSFMDLEKSYKEYKGKYYCAK